MKRFLIKDGVPREAVEAAFPALGWRRVDSENSMPEVIRYKSSWVGPGDAAVANYLENIPFEASYVLASDAAFDSLRECFSDKGWLLDKSDVLAAELDGGALRTIGRLGLLAHGEFDSAVFAKLSALILHPNDAWQRFALYALTNTSWSEFGPVVQEAIDEGLVEGDLVDSARAILAGLEDSNWNEALYRG
jgi:hypothetical protein